MAELNYVSLFICIFLAISRVLSGGQKILVATGLPFSNGQKTEVIDSQDSTVTCQLPDYPKEMNDGAGGIINSKTVLICEGRINGGENIGDCYSLKANREWTKVANLNAARYGMSTGNLVIDGSLWISGGYDASYSDLDSIEWVDEDGVKEATNVRLPFEIYGHCSIQIDNNTIVTTGGYSGYRNKKDTHILNLNTQQWSTGPVLNQGRNRHGCGRVTIGSKKFALVTGGWDDLNGFEFLDLDDLNGKWTNGNVIIYYLIFNQFDTNVISFQV